MALTETKSTKTRTSASHDRARSSRFEQILRKSGKFLKIGLSLFGILAVALIFNPQLHDEFIAEAALTDVSADNDIRFDGSNSPKSSNGTGATFAENNGYNWYFSGSKLYIRGAGPFRFSGAGENIEIVVADDGGTGAEIYFDNLTIDNSNSNIIVVNCAFYVKDGKTANVNLIGDNSITGRFSAYGFYCVNSILNVDGSSGGKLYVDNSDYAFYSLANNGSGSASSSISITDSEINVGNSRYAFYSLATLANKGSGSASSSINITDSKINVDNSDYAFYSDARGVSSSGLGSGSVSASIDITNSGINVYNYYYAFYSDARGVSSFGSASASISVTDSGINVDDSDYAFYSDARGDSASASIDTTNCLVFQDGIWEVVGNFTLNHDLTFPEGCTLTVPEGATLTIDGTLRNIGTIENNGALRGIGKIILYGTITGRGPIDVMVQLPKNLVTA